MQLEKGSDHQVDFLQLQLNVTDFVGAEHNRQKQTQVNTEPQEANSPDRPFH